MAESSSSSSDGGGSGPTTTDTATSAPTNTSARPRPVHILFVGAGAVGCFYASRLHHPAHDVHVSLTARSNYPAIASSGVALQTRSFGDYTFRPHAVFPSASAAVPGGNNDDDDNNGRQRRRGRGPSPPADGWDYVVVTTKALPDRADDAALIAPLVSPARTCIVLIQNGVGVEAPYRARFPRNPVVSAVTVISAEQTAPGVVRQNRWTRISLGPYAYGLEGRGGDGGGSKEKEKGEGGEEESALLAARGRECMEQLARWWGPGWGGIRDVETHDERALQTIRWHKLCINAAFNPTAVLCGGRGNAEQLTDPELRRHVAAVMAEIWDAAPRVLGAPLPEGLATPERIIASTERNAGARPSMLLDWEAGRPMELEVILGNPVRIARRAGVEMPRLQSMYALLRSMQATRERARGKERL
ncbi:2-dehydropantoate 2-reductase [Xylaria palmicola]|nr:2-dehydropantoate 2-reductase [Xylaria palmicola]